MELEAAPIGVLILTGLLLGALHSLSPDHIVAVLPLSLDAGAQSWRIGVQWGGGHALGIAAVAAGAYGAREVIVPEAFEHVGEMLIGVVLIGIGLWGLWHRRAVAGSLAIVDRPSHPAAHAEPTRGHAHLAGGGHVHTAISFGVGMLHGVVGSGAILGALPVLTLSSWGRAAAYVGGFGLGGVAAIGLTAVAVGWIARDRMRGREALYVRVFTVTCWLAIASGAALCIWEILVH